ncbi:hypothetical protein J4477_05010 [Candidatus Pacearchaeota archaeon]|nr:hypothetical protein [Candidatus Pacearchaeota archaeon]
MSVTATIPKRDINTIAKGNSIFFILLFPSSIRIKQNIKSTVRNIGEISPKLFIVIINEFGLEVI